MLVEIAWGTNCAYHIGSLAVQNNVERCLIDAMVIIKSSHQNPKAGDSGRRSAKTIYLSLQNVKEYTEHLLQVE